MSKEVTVLGLERGMLRGVRLVENGKQWERSAVESWPLEPEAPVAEENNGAALPSDDAEGDALDNGAVSGEEDVLAAAFAAAVKRFGTHEFALALPLSEMLVKTVSVPLESRDDPQNVKEALEGISPFPGEELLPGIETVAEGDDSVHLIAAALPEAAYSPIGEALDAAKVRVVRTDATALGWLRALWPQIVQKDAARRLVLLNLDGGWDLVVLHEGAISFLRGIGEVADAATLARETMLSLIQCGAGEIGDVVVCAHEAPDAEILSKLGTFGPVRTVLAEDPDAGIEGVALRITEDCSFDITPAAWSEVRKEARFRKRLLASLAIAGGIWLAVMAVFFGVPMYYDYLADCEKDASKAQQRAYREVKDMRDRVKLVQRYSDHARGALEMLKVFSDAMPDGVILSSFQYRRGESVRVAGEAEQPTDVYSYKDALAKIEFEDETRLFSEVKLTGPSATRGGRHKFEVEAVFEGKEEK